MSLSIRELSQLLQSIAPLHLAADWDNVGMLLEPALTATSSTSNVLLTIDLSPQVLNEAMSVDAGLVVAYHPPLVGGLTRLSVSDPISNTLIEAARRGIFIYSPHTALDAAPGGLTDWLAEAVSDAPCRPIIDNPEATGAGEGRRGTLKPPRPLTELVTRIKTHLGLDHVRVAAPAKSSLNHSVERFAVCAGAGGSVLKGVNDVDLILTGEMRHHDILANIARGTAVIVCDHTHTERGYLRPLAERLTKASQGAVKVIVSESDREPLRVV
jgi:dinuclear metal center YbgI/SA1388 family protein